MADQQDTTAELRREPADLIQQLRGRAAFCRARGEVKTPDLLEEAATRLAAAEALANALPKHHEWHLSQDGDGEARGIDPVDAYSESGLCEETVAALALVPADALAELQRLREAVAQRDHVVAAWAEVSQTNYQRAKAAEAERDAALVRVEKLRHQITEASDPDFIWGALDNVHDAETTLDDYAAAVSRAIRGALATVVPPADTGEGRA